MHRRWLKVVQFVNTLDLWHLQRNLCIPSSPFFSFRFEARLFNFSVLWAFRTSCPAFRDEGWKIFSFLPLGAFLAGFEAGAMLWMGEREGDLASRNDCAAGGVVGRTCQRWAPIPGQASSRFRSCGHVVQGIGEERVCAADPRQ